MLVLLSGVSGAGKDTIKKELIKRMDNVVSLPSYTDRPLRIDEVPGELYNHVTAEEFEKMVEAGEFYEYSLHHKHYYGTSRKLMNEKIESGKIIVKDIDVNGTENLIELLKEDTKVVTIFLRVPKDKQEIKEKIKEKCQMAADRGIIYYNPLVDYSAINRKRKNAARNL